MFISGGKAGAFLWIEKSSDRVWRKVPLSLTHGVDAAGPFSIASRTDKVPFRNVISVREMLMAVGGDYTRPNDPSGTAAWSEDRGSTWHSAITPPHGYRSAVAWSDTGEVWIAVGTNGSDISRDDGKTWSPLPDQPDNSNWNALAPPFVVGSKGRIARLTWK
jgi:hypothetical protein